MADCGSFIPKVRFYIVLSTVSLLMLFLIGYLLHIQLAQREFLTKEGKARSFRVAQMDVHRGIIFDRNQQPLAVSTQVFSIGIDPQIFKLTEQKATQISQILDIKPEFITKQSQRSNSRLVYLKHNVPPHIANQLKIFKIAGLHLQTKEKRYYPAAQITAHLVGFTNNDNQGQEGLELKYNDLLKAVYGSKKVVKDLDGNIIKDMGIIKQPISGKDLKLSIDLRTQYIAYKELQKQIYKTSASAGSVVVLDPQNGHILAMVNLPSYNPNARAQLDFAHLRNRAVTDTFEPGSTIKPFTLALALAKTKLTPSSIINTAPGYLKINQSTIRDLKNYGKLSVSQILSKSSNVGTAKIALQLPEHALVNLLDDLGFGRKTISTIIGTKSGHLPLGKRLSKLERATIAYGYGMSTTLLQLAKAYMILARDGTSIPVNLLINKQKFLPERLLSVQQSRAIKKMLVAAVGKKGTGSKSQIAGFNVAGKTGTVHKTKTGSGYQHNKYLAIFAGMVPVNKPQLVIAIMVDSPQGNTYYGGEVAAPIFANIAARTLRIAKDNNPI